MSDEKKAKAAAPARPRGPASKPAAIGADPATTETPKVEAVKVAKPKAAPKPKAAKPAAPVATAPEPGAEEAPKGDKKDGKPKKEKKEKKKARKKEKRKKEAVIIRFEDVQLPQIDARAEALGLSRAAWVRMVVAQALAKG